MMEISCPKEFNSGVNAIAAYVSQGEPLERSAWIVCCSSDPLVRVWRATMDSYQTLSKWVLIANIDVGTCIQHSAAITALRSPSPKQGRFLQFGVLKRLAPSLMLALGGTDSAVRLFASTGSNDFVLACVLRGHEDWIRGLDFSTQSEKLLLASASQDRSSFSDHTSPDM